VAPRSLGKTTAWQSAGEVIVKTTLEQPEPLGGQPAPSLKPSVVDLDYQVKYQRAFEAIMWAMPAVSILGFRHGEESLGVNKSDSR
jgi:hypothetical protein